MQSAAISASDKLGDKIKTLEESASFIADLAKSVPEHSEWLWDIAEKLTHEATVLQRHSLQRSATMPDST
jgi:3-methyladenine DNA glycosylase Tag